MLRGTTTYRGLYKTACFKWIPPYRPNSCHVPTRRLVQQGFRGGKTPRKAIIRFVYRFYGLFLFSASPSFARWQLPFHRVSRSRFGLFGNSSPCPSEYVRHRTIRSGCQNVFQSLRRLSAESIAQWHSRYDQQPLAAASQADASAYATNCETVVRLQSVLLGGQLLYAAESRQRPSSALESATTVGRKL